VSLSSLIRFVVGELIKEKLKIDDFTQEDSAFTEKIE